MEYLNHLISSVVLSISALFGAQAPVAEQAPQMLPVTTPTEIVDVSKTEEDDALNNALTELRGVREKLQQPEVVEGAYPRPRRPQVAKPATPQQQPQQQPSTTPSFVKEATKKTEQFIQPTSGSPLAGSFEGQQATGAILMRPLPHQNIELAYREVPAAIGSHYELEWDIPQTLTCSFVVFVYRTDAQVSDTWMKTITGKGKRNTDPLYQDQRYRLLCRDAKGVYHADTILFRTRSQAKALPTCTIVPSRNRAKDGESITYTIGGTDIETFAFGNTRPTVPSSSLRFPFDHTVKVRRGAEPFSVSVGNRLGTSTCNALITIDPAE